MPETEPTDCLGTAVDPPLPDFLELTGALEEVEEDRRHRPLDVGRGGGWAQAAQRPPQLIHRGMDSPPLHQPALKVVRSRPALFQGADKSGSPQGPIEESLQTRPAASLWDGDRWGGVVDQVRKRRGYRVPPGAHGSVRWAAHPRGQWRAQGLQLRPKIGFLVRPNPRVPPPVLAEDRPRQAAVLHLIALSPQEEVQDRLPP